MQEWLVVATHYSVIVIDVMALIVVMAGTIEAFFRGMRVNNNAERNPHRGAEPARAARASMKIARTRRHTQSAPHPAEIEAPSP